MALSGQDQIKLVNAGFKILRTQKGGKSMDEPVYIIKESTGTHGGWQHVHKTTLFTEHQKHLKILLKDPKTIQEDFRE